MAIGSQRCERRQIGVVMKYRGRDVLARHGKLLGISEMVKTGALEHKKHRSRGKDGENWGLACGLDVRNGYTADSLAVDTYSADFRTGGQKKKGSSIIRFRRA